MQLLIITQTVNTKNPVLGFFHEWIKKLAARYETVIVICLEAGQYDLPANTRVFSLGKENGIGTLGYVKNFFSIIWRERKKYDAVFVHMNEEYVLLGGWLWCVLGKRIVLWRNHVQGTIKTRLAVVLSHRVLCTSPHSFTAKFKKTQICAAGVDTDLFSFSENKIFSNPIKILLLGRISQVKNIHLILSAFILALKKIPLTVTVVGDAITDADQNYFLELKKTFAQEISSATIQFVGACSHTETKQFFANHDVYINATNSGSLDKTILEAMASGCLPLITNTSFAKWLPDAVSQQIISPYSAEAMAVYLEKLAALAEPEKQALRQTLRAWVENEQSLSKLIPQISQNLG